MFNDLGVNNDKYKCLYSKVFEQKWVCHLFKFNKI